MIDQITREKIHNMPKIELHLHIDGSLDINIIKDKYKLSNDEIKNNLIADEKCRNLNDYLTKFNYPIKIMQTKKDIELLAESLLIGLKKQNIIYTEMRFAPQFHTKKGLTQEEVVKSVLLAMSKVDIKSNLILCIMRGKDNEKENYETIDIAKKYLGRGVCAVDLAGAEAIHKTEEYKQFFEYVKKLNIPYTLHAGEADGPTSISSAIEFGTKRIGHGVRSIEDSNIIKKIIDNNITLEVCPTSNIQTCICKDYSSHPIEKLYRLGVKTTINTDNMTVSDTTLENEYIKLIENTTITLKEILDMNKNSIKASFLSEIDKREIMEELEKYEI